MLRAAVNVDVDGLYLYDRIHGYAGGSGNSDGFDAARHDPAAWTRGVARFLDLFDRTGVRGTFFVVAQDLAHPDALAVFREAVAAGHEIGNHAFSHPYDLSRLPRAAMLEEVRGAKERLQDAGGVEVVGFRAPGYVLSETLLDVVAESGHVYDSSRFPCPPYQAAKALAIGAYRALGRPSGSIPERPDVWLGRRTPYTLRTASGHALVELPIGTVPGVRMPFIGTSLIAFGELGWQATRLALQNADWMHLECHAIDLCDVDRDALPERLRAQPDQRVPFERKWPLMVRALESMRRTHEVRTLAEWAAAVRG